MPLRLIGIDAEDARKARPALTAVERALPATWLSAPLPLTRLVQGRHPLSMNATRLTDRITTGKPSEPAPVPSLVLEPAWCTLMDRDVLVVSVADARTNQLLGSAHAAVPRDQWEALTESGGLPGRFNALARAALASAAQRGARADTDALHAELDLGRNVTRTDEGSSLCLTLLVEEQLAKDLIVARRLGADMLATARDQLGQIPELRRPTRRALLVWRNLPEGGTAAKRTLPVTLDLDTTMAESVLGRHLPIPVYRSRWTFGVGAGGQVAFTVDGGFRKLFDAERDTLRLVDAPQIAKIDRAWVYLDRGRAWGLKMGDRLVAVGANGEPIRGHVVRFFGPEDGVVSPRGFPVREGAILYIRKGQRATKVGQTFAFDARTFPTPWPPPAAGATASAKP